ncbi:methyl-accepting chemotaxis protein [Acetonema longum]|uniref:methyl-accepting chemotaxis protein n=1 Tax=Acetonema longum TaxID=2374 RepID=UPI002378F75C|nr:methyl-accepting chemotaxis protein [Acetonema longum]
MELKEDASVLTKNQSFLKYRLRSEVVHMVGDIRIIFTGMEQLVMEETLEAFLAGIGKTVDARTCPMDKLPEHSAADLFVCAKSLKERMPKTIPVEKTLCIEMVPVEQFYIDVTKVPDGSTVYVLSNSTNYARRLVQMCQERNIDHITYEYILVNELSEQEIIGILREANYVMGVATTMEKKGVVYEQYKPYLREDIKLIGAKRTLNLPSFLELMQWITTFRNTRLFEHITDGTQKQAQQLQQLTSITNTISRSTDAEIEMFKELSVKMENGMERLKQVIQFSESLTAATQNIGGIAGSIRHLSSQTHLLSLNATIEAARVGEQGRGFAVVAKEVGKLAEESQKSTDMILKAVKEVQAAVVNIIPALSSLSNELKGNQDFYGKVLQNSIETNQSLVHVFQMVENIRRSSEVMLDETGQLVNLNSKA